MHFRPLLWPTVFGVAGLAILVALGTWQMQRLAWKTDLIARVEARVIEPPEPLPPKEAWLALDLEALEYRPYSVAGVFDHNREVHVFTSLPDPKGVHGGPGYWVMTPLFLGPTRAVWVNRGFVPEEFKWGDRRSTGLSEGVVQVTGLLRRSEEPSLFTPSPDHSDNVWFVREISSMTPSNRSIGWGPGQEYSMEAVAPFFLDALESPPGGLPQGGETRLVFHNSHLEYALTWYGLALALIAVYLAYHWTEGRIGRTPRKEPN